MNKRFALKFFLSLLSAYVLLIVGLNLHIHVALPYESGAYLGYMKSIVQDGDLNLVNNLDSAMTWITSTTHNYPDMHDAGAPILWAPLYAFATLTNHLFDLPSIILQGSPFPVGFDFVVVFIMNIFFGLVGLKIIRFLLSDLFSLNPPAWTLAIVVGGTGFLNFLLYQFTTADLTVFFYAAFMIYAMSFMDDKWSRGKFFLLGLMFGFGSVIKIDFPLLLPVYAYFNYRKLNLKNVKSVFVKNLFFILGIGCVLSFEQINNFIKFGITNLDQGYSYAYNLKNLFSPIPSWRAFFGPAGLFTVSPLSLIATISLLLVFVSLFKKQKRDNDIKLFFLAVGTSFIAKHLLNLTIIFDGCTGFGARQYMIDSIVLYMTIALIYKNREDQGKGLSWVKLLMLACLAWTMIEYLWWLEITTYPVESFNAYFIQDYSVPFHKLSELVKNFSAFMANFPKHFIKNIRLIFILIPPVLGWFALEKFVFDAKNPGRQRVVFQLGSAMILLYVTVTMLNLYFNPKNVEEMKAQNVFVSKVIGNGKEVFLYDEYVDTFVYAMDVAKYNKNRPWFEYHKGLLLDMLERSKSEIVYDPINFKAQLEIDHLRKAVIDVQTDIDYNRVLDFNAPVAFKVWK